MGKGRSYEMIEYRSIIMNKICKSKELVKLLGCENEEYPEDIIPYTCVHPHEYVPNVVTKTERFLNYEINARYDSKNRTYKNITIYFFVLCHQDVIRYTENGRTYLWYDKVVCELENLFSDQYVLGVGKTEYEDNMAYCPQPIFKGRMLKFEVKEFNNGKKYGK